MTYDEIECHLEDISITLNNIEETLNKLIEMFEGVLGRVTEEKILRFADALLKFYDTFTTEGKE